MEIDKNEWGIIQKALDVWVQSGKLSPEKISELKKDLTIKNAERQQVAQYFFVIALSSMLLAFGAIFIDDKFLEKIKKYFDLNDFVIAIATTIISVVWFWYIRKRKKQFETFTYEIYMTLGGLGVITSLVYICKVIATGSSYAPFLAIASILLIILSILFTAKALWIGGLLAFMGWYGIFSYDHSMNNLFLGMNYPMRFTVFGLIVLCISFLQSRIRQMDFTVRITYTAGLLIFLTGLWGVSIFGNYNTIVEWEKVRQTHVLTYAIVFGIISVFIFYLGIRLKDSTARDFGIMFLLINLYTRYFEYFWDTLNKGIFFLVLAATFWFLGKWLQKNRSHQDNNLQHRA